MKVNSWGCVFIFVAMALTISDGKASSVPSSSLISDTDYHHYRHSKRHENAYKNQYLRRKSRRIKDGNIYKPARFDRKFGSQWYKNPRVFHQATLNPVGTGSESKTKLKPSLGNSKLSTNAITSDGNSIILDYECHDSDKVLCQKAEEAYRVAVNYITQVIKTIRPIKVKAIFASFCKHSKDCDNDTLGQAAATAYWTLAPQDSVDSQYWYPQALAKQVSKADLDWNPYDITIQFNSDVPKTSRYPQGSRRFWFKGDPKMKTFQFDFEYVALHELIHGLGIMSLWSAVASKSLSSETPFLTPSYETTSENGNEMGRFDGIRPLHIFDKYIYSTDTNENIAKCFKVFQDSGLTKSMSFDQFKARILNSSAYSEGKRLYNMMTKSGSLELRLPVPDENAKRKFQNADIELDTNDQVSILLHTDYAPFREGSSVSHFDQKKYTNHKDFLMRPEAQNGVTLLEITPKDSFPIGPETIRLLYTIGYDLVEEPIPKLGLGIISNAFKNSFSVWNPIAIALIFGYMQIYFL